ncbi:MAG: MotA/TolQ/ExbB proton channel family protein [Bdellovibrionales bacterium]|nr:MotA/TolQ/ExbB proton channel family protein [Bdellovibrionales bacterium]
MFASILQWFQLGGFIMWPLLGASIAIWVILFERFARYRSVGRSLRTFQLESMNRILKQDWTGLEDLCRENPDLPSSALIQTALSRLRSEDPNLKARWQEAVERRRQVLNQELKQGLWILGTIASAAPFVGLFGTVLGILRSFQEMAKTGAGGFTVVAAGISEALIATAAGIAVAVIAVVGYNSFQTRYTQLVALIRLQTEEWVETLSAVAGKIGAPK